LLCAGAFAEPVSRWTLVRSQHFEVYSQGPESTARTALAWFEQLRAFFLRQTGLKLDSPARVRVIGFRSAQEYQAYRLRASADAYYAAIGNREYIVMAGLDAGELGVAAHEYAHLILRACGLSQPHWLNEGLAEFYSTVRIGAQGSTLGGDLPANTQILRRRSWMPLAELLAVPAGSPFTEDRDGAALFYGESWALAEMLVLSPEYGPRFQALIAALTVGTPSLQALTTVFSKSAQVILSDAHAWVDNRRRFTPVALAGVVPDAAVVEVSELSPFAARLLMADLLVTSGELDRADALYRDLAREAPDNADVHAALGAIALRKGDSAGARQEWKRAIQQGIGDAELCYRYAVLADTAGLPREEIVPVLERAVSLQPDFDDARYKLALMEKNAGHYEIALGHFRAMHTVAPERAFDYWIAVADALNELDRREEAKAAAKQAADRAATPAQRARAAQLAYMAQTDLAVSFSRGANGRAQMVTTRVPHNTSNNPFIEPADDLRRVQGALREIECTDKITRLLVDAPEGRLRLAILDPTHVQMRNAPAEFTCGKQPGNQVWVEYAAARSKEAGTDGVVRGVEFR
jgi:tetratricopeptide (TPR) repeat protein